MKILIATDRHVLARLPGILPFAWYEQHDQAMMRDDGLIYIGGFKTQIAAEAWAVKQGMIDDTSQSIL